MSKRKETTQARQFEPDDFSLDFEAEDNGVTDWVDAESGELTHAKSFQVEDLY